MAVSGEVTTTRACVLKAAKNLQLETHPLPPPGPDELQIAIRATGLCGSDLHYYNNFRNGDIVVREPLALGHESAGVVTAVGADVAANGSFRVGDAVALEVGVPCGACEHCVSRRYNICAGMQFRSSARAFPHFQGTLQDRINHPAAWCHRLSSSSPSSSSSSSDDSGKKEDIPLALGALLEPLSVAIHGARRAGGDAALAGKTVAVLGAGAVGALTAAVAKVKGARTVVIADIDAGRVDFAVRNGFAHVGYAIPLPTQTKDKDNSNKTTMTVQDEMQAARDTAMAIRAVKAQDGEPVGEFDVTFECTGVTSCVRTGIYACKPGGKLMLIGMGTPTHLLPISDAALREVDILGVFRYANTYPEGIEMVSSSSTPDFSKLVTHTVRGLENAEEAFRLAGRTKDDDGNLIMKVVLETGS